MTFIIKQADFPEDTQTLETLIHEYVSWLDMDLTSRGFYAEMAHIETVFSPPGGLFLIARCDGVAAGCVGLKRLPSHTAEIKRLYVKPAFRGQQLGRQLLNALFEKAAEHAIERLILDAVPQTVKAQRLYEEMGFRQIEAYYSDPVPGTRFYEIDITPREAVADKAQGGSGTRSAAERRWLTCETQVKIRAACAFTS